MITFIAPAFNENPLVFIGSMLCQTNKNWKAIIYHNGPNNGLKEIIDKLNDDRFVYIESKENTGAWGCYNRIDAVNNMVDTEYVIQTSIQDYWLPNSVDYILRHSEIDFIYWNSINHLDAYADGKLLFIGYDRIMDTIPAGGYMDWGNFAVKTAIAKNLGITNPEDMGADGLFINALMASGLCKTKLKLNNVLTIHN